MSLSTFYNSTNLVGIGSVGIGTTSPYNTLDVYGSQITRNPTVYSNTVAATWYNLGLWDCSIGAGGYAGQRLRLELLGGNGYDNNTGVAQWGGVTTIYATIMNNSSGSVANCGGTFKHDGSAACATSVKFVQNGGNRNQYYVYAYINTFTQHGLRIDTTQGSAFTPSFTVTTDPGVDSASVRAAVFSAIIGYGSGGYVGIGTTNPGAALQVGPGSVYQNAPTQITKAAFMDTGTGTQQVSLFLGTESTNFNGAFMAWNNVAYGSTTNYLSLAHYGTSNPTLSVTAQARVGIGISNPGVQLDLSTDGARKLTTSTWATGSDQRIKTDIQSANLRVCYDVIKSIDLKYFKWNFPESSNVVVDDKHSLGFIAQEVMSVFPNAVSESNSYGYTDFLSLNTDQILKAMYGALKQTIADKEALESRLAALEQQVNGSGP
jgi:Chaperone of endosialidase